MKKRKTPDLEKYLEGKKRRFVNYTQGAKIYRMSYWPFVRLAKKAEANYPIRKTAIVDLNILDDFLEDNPDVEKELIKELLQTLTERQKEIIYLYFWEQMNQMDIAKSLGISQQTVAGTIKRSIEIMKKHANQ